jgi:choline kinase
VRIVGVGEGLFPLVHQVRRCTLEIAGRELVDNIGQKLLKFGGQERSFVTGLLLAKQKLVLPHKQRQI